MNKRRLQRAAPGWTLNLTMATLAAAALLVGCSRTPDADTTAAPEAASAESFYTARLQPLNQQITGAEASGEITFAVTGDRLTIATDARGLPPGMTHWQHFHGFADGREASCPGADADQNGDGIIDLIETEPVSGTTMVPFNADPVAMDIPHDSYPASTSSGALHYEKTVSLGALQEAFGKAFEGRELDLDTRVVYLHGVPSESALASSVASLGPIPAHVTLPIACGEIQRVK